MVAYTRKAEKVLDLTVLRSFVLGTAAVTASAAELNKLDGAGAVVASGTKAAKIADPTGGATVDTQARAAIVAIIDALEAFGLSAAS